jgi:hypothetical protein
MHLGKAPSKEFVIARFESPRQCTYHEPSTKRALIIFATEAVHLDFLNMPGYNVPYYDW